MTAPVDALFRVGIVTGTHGLRGDLKVRPLTPDSPALLAAREVCFVCGDKGVQWRRPVRASLHKGFVLLRLEGLESIDAVQDMVGCEVMMTYGDLGEPAADEFYWFEIQGMAVLDRQRGELGTLEEMFTTAAHDIYVVRGRFGEILVPAVDEFIVEIDRERRRMTVDLPEGLVPDHNEH